jgi:ATP-dependent helicase HepA
MLFKGMLVELPMHKGIAKLISVAQGNCEVAVFHSILRTETVCLKLADIARAYLSPQTRVYVRHEDRVRVGRVTNYLRQENGLIDYEVRFPNDKISDISELDLYVRPWNAPEDPGEILAAGGAESQFLHDRRQAGVLPLLALRSAAQGLTSLLSGGVDFVPHQIAAVRRVLTDPIQRYLLADEVGLGKTIEAGLIIRQHLIDNPDTGILIATPPHLCEQWRSELVGKLRLDQFGERVEICTHASLVRVARTPDILVVDEAHHVVGVESGALADAARRLQELANNVPVLLLLSATPALGNEARFLALLNLLDPATHPLEDLDGFRTKLQQRRNIGRLLLSLDPDSPALVLRQRSTELERLFPNDSLVQELAPHLVTATRERPEIIPSLCAALKEHIADSYRIHHRLIRSRRADAKGWEFMPRGPIVDGEPVLSHVRCETNPDEQVETLLASLEDWRFSAMEATQGDEMALRAAASRYAGLLTAANLGPAALSAWLAAAPVSFAGEDDILASLRAIAAESDDSTAKSTMVESTLRLLRSLKAEVPSPKIVVFASSGQAASAFYQAFKGEAEATAACYLGEEVIEASAEAIATFTSSSKGAILVTGPWGEEGLNLSCADAIVHLDLPLSAARLEQRIGRLDRFGRRQSVIRHRLLLPSDDESSPWAAWFEFLASGLLIFNRSISDVQFLLDSIEEEAFRTLFELGPEGLRALAASARARIGEERRSQDEQYALDRIALAEEPVDDFIQRLESAEEDESALERSVDHWLLDALQFKKYPFAWPEQDPFKLIATPTTLVPKLPWLGAFEIDDDQALTWKRRVAMRRPEVTLLRPGTPIVDIIERFTRWDDRGTAFITWRTAPDWSGGLWIGFRLSFVFEPNIEISDLLAPTCTELAMSRRAQRYLPPSSHVLHIDINGEALDNKDLLEILDAPYSANSQGQKPADLNLASRPELFAEVIDPISFQLACRRVRDTARGVLASRPKIKAQIAAAVVLAERDAESRRKRLLRRESAGDAMARADIELIESILPTLAQPAIRLDAMGCFVVSQHPPQNKTYA